MPISCDNRCSHASLVENEAPGKQIPQNRNTRTIKHIKMLSESHIHVKQLAKKGQDNVLILGAAGRDFHDFMTYWSHLPNTEVVAITAQQIPGIDNRIFPAELCHNEENGNLYPHGIQIAPEEDLESLIKSKKVTTCVLAYSDLKFETVQSLAARVNAAGAKFVQLPPILTMLESSKPVIAVCASRTGVGKSQTTRYIAKYLKSKGLRVAAVRHPMPYDKDLLSQRCQRYEKEEDMDKYHCTIEEREEYDRHIANHTLLFAGVDYQMILREAEKDADGKLKICRRLEIVTACAAHTLLPFLQSFSGTEATMTFPSSSQTCTLRSSIPCVQRTKRVTIQERRMCAWPT